MFLNSAIVAKTFYCRVEDFSGRLLVRIHNARSLILLTFGSFLALNLDHTTHHPSQSHYIITHQINPTTNNRTFSLQTFLQIYFYC
jgi:hypothetical protein